MTDNSTFSPAPGATRPPPPAPPPGFPAAVTAGKSYRGMAVGSLVCALVGIPLISPILSTVAIVLGAIARTKMRASHNFDGRGMALAGIIIGTIELVISLAIIAVIIALAVSGN